MEQYDANQRRPMDATKCGVHKMRDSSILSQNEALRRLTLIKHRKVSTQLKLDMVQRQLSHLRRSATESDSDRFYRLQEQELSSELRDLVSTLDREEGESYFLARRSIWQEQMKGGGSSVDLSSSTSTSTSIEDLRCRGRSSLKKRVCHLMSSPTSRFRKRNNHLFGELRAVASLSALNTKSHSPTHSDEGQHSPKEGGGGGKSWRAPLRFLGNLVDNTTGFRRRLFSSSAKRTKSADNILEDDDDKKTSTMILRKKQQQHGGSVDSSFSASSSSDDEELPDEAEGITVDDLMTQKRLCKLLSRSPLMRSAESAEKPKIDPAILAEIEEFEKMVARYLAEHA